MDIGLKVGEHRGHIAEVADGFCFVHGPREGHIPFAHSILLTGKRTILIDTGLGAEFIGRLRRRYDIKLILNSHYHRDHNWGNSLFPGVPILAHISDAGALNSMHTYFSCMGVLGRKDFPTIKRETFSFIPHIRGPKVGAFRDGDRFSSGDTTVEVIHLPGHSPGHCGFYHRSSGTLFSADICPDSFGPWYGHTCASIDEFEKSIERIISISPKRIITAHTPAITGNITSNLREYSNKIQYRDDHIIGLLERPRTVAALLKEHPIYRTLKGTLRLPFRYWEEVMVKKHLERLKTRGLVRQSGTRFLRAQGA